MAKQKGKKKGASTDQIFDMLTGDGEHLPPNVGQFTGTMAGKDVEYVCAENKDGDIVPIALLLDARTRDLLEDLQVAATGRHDDDEEDGDEDEEDGENDDDSEDFEP